MIQRHPATTRPTWRLTALTLSVVLVATVLVSGPGPAGAVSSWDPGGGELERERGTNPRLATSLQDDAEARRPMLSAARPEHVQDAPAGLVTVVIETTDAAATQVAVAEVGGSVAEALPTVVKADVPPRSLEALASSPGTTLVREPYYPRLEAQSEGVAQTGAGPWQTAGWNGYGTKVAIVDGGFLGYSGKLGTELPIEVDTDLDRCGSPGITAHGTAVAEIVHDMAPDAELLLVCIEDDVDFVSVMATMQAQGVDVINGSFGFTLTGRGDGSGGPSTLAGAVAQVREQGILYVASSSNYGQHHFHANAVGDPVQGDENSDFLNLSPDDSFLFAVAGNGDVAISVQWDAWPTTRQDFDVYVGNDACGLVAASTLDQANAALPPIEFLTFSNCRATAQTFELLVNRYQGAATPRIDLYFDGDVGQIEHITGSSVVEPASSPAVMAVGAYCVGTGTRQPYSGQGPTIDGRTKPDLSAPDATSSSVYGNASGCTGGFTGTSASSPHAAGAAALLLGASPDLDVAELQQLMEDRAVDAGPAGDDNQYGAGRLQLGAAGSAAVARAQPYTSTGPIRLLDSRPGALGAAESAFGPSGRTTPIAGGGTLRLQVRSIAGVPADATAVVLNVTAVSPTKAGYLTVYPSGQRPVASNLNFAAHQTVGVNVTATVASDGRVTLYNSSGSTHVVVDLAGWYGPTGAGAPAVTRFNSLPSPVRALNTQPTQAGYAEGPFGPGGATTPIGSGQSIAVQLAGLGGVASDATAVIVNVAAVAPAVGGHLTLYPDGSPKPVASSINFATGQTIANLAVVPVGSGGRVRIAAQGTTHVVVDVVGAFRPGVGAGYVALDPPVRQLNTLSGTGLRRTALGGGATHKLKVGRYDGVPGDALAAAMSVAVVQPTASGYLTVYPGTKPRPGASNLNFTKGIVLANAAVAALGTDGTVAFTNSAGSTHVVADLAGYFIDPAKQPVPLTTPPVPPPPPEPPPNAPADAATTYQGNALHDGVNAATTLDLPLSEAWRHDFGARVGYPLLVNGRVFVTANPPSTNHGANLFALDAVTGEVEWGPVPVGGTYYFDGIAADGANVYSINYDGLLIALDQATGEEVWRKQLDTTSVTSPPTVDDGTVFVSATAAVFAVNAATGSVRWTKSLSGGDHSAPAVTADAVYVSYSCELSYRLNRLTGATVWTHTTGCVGGGGRTPAVHDGKVYIREPWGPGSMLSMTTGAKVGSYTASAVPSLHAGRGFYVSSTGLTAFDLATGTSVWTATGDGHLTTAPVVADGLVIVGSTEGRLYAYDEQTGAERWTVASGFAIDPPDEHNAVMVAGLAVAESTLLVPAGETLIAYR